MISMAERGGFPPPDRINWLDKERARDIIQAAFLNENLSLQDQTPEVQYVLNLIWGKQWPIISHSTAKWTILSEELERAGFLEDPLEGRSNSNQKVSIEYSLAEQDGEKVIKIIEEYSRGDIAVTDKLILQMTRRMVKKFTITGGFVKVIVLESVVATESEIKYEVTAPDEVPVGFLEMQGITFGNSQARVIEKPITSKDINRILYMTFTAQGYGPLILPLADSGSRG